MTPNLGTCTWLLLPCCVLITLSTGELKFYQDEVPEPSERVVLRQLIKYLEEQSQRHRGHEPRPQRSYFDPLLASQARSKHQLELDWPKEKYLLEALASKDLKKWNYQRTPYNEPSHELPRESEHYLPFYDLNPFHNSLEYPSFKLPYPRENAGSQDEDYDRDAPFKHSSFERTRDFDQGMKEEPTLEFHENFAAPMNEHSEKLMQKPHYVEPEFTFRFDDSNLKERHPFAVKPNDPRYYQDVPFFFGGDEKPSFKEPAKNEQTRTMNVEDAPRFEETLMTNAVPELERRTDQGPLVVPVNMNNDIFFIAIVAGCSAAAMFALVLVILTWCRLKRGAKAAADIEYPAYGVTGPNKEVSPSGDQRLAQSAQMYHFQHQKQQIIAMEKDPGSVSEAESEEENEEGDYTVYECPGLATFSLLRLSGASRVLGIGGYFPTFRKLLQIKSNTEIPAMLAKRREIFSYRTRLAPEGLNTKNCTMSGPETLKTGEMEVKNPLFHDDPTPATPAQTNKEEDHI